MKKAITLIACVTFVATLAFAASPAHALDPQTEPSRARINMNPQPKPPGAADNKMVPVPGGAPFPTGGGTTGGGAAPNNTCAPHAHKTTDCNAQSGSCNCACDDGYELATSLDGTYCKEKAAQGGTGGPSTGGQSVTKGSGGPTLCQTGNKEADSKCMHDHDVQHPPHGLGQQ